ncbi:hypothetical protein N643_13290 [Salmonella bongori serovar 48:z41:-- str. RKS3044]|uniref:Uncharacterized protein n=1 Tax=Salmonella bongori N268-08 TaxID=1197719 RepID=S5MU96_SALBN|nr:hypothetical protein A464_3127 [Salmonella bongori N268-08]AID27454.1 hypothetical protein N643_13290 [Salmonella bongori serovar 48:z41:-- str. RKS3044]
MAGERRPDKRSAIKADGGGCALSALKKAWSQPPLPISTD